MIKQNNAKKNNSPLQSKEKLILTQAKQLFSKVSSDGQLELFLKDIKVPIPKAHEVIVLIEAAPINPSDMVSIFGLANLAEAKYDATKQVLTAPVPVCVLPHLKSRLDQTLPIGTEGAGIVVDAGDSVEAQALLGKVVGLITGAAYAEYCVAAKACLVHNEGTSPYEASSFANPLTALSMVDTMREEGHSALIFTAAASNLGQMLNKTCLAQDVPMVNIVRNQQQVDI